MTLKEMLISRKASDGGQVKKLKRGEIDEPMKSSSVTSPFYYILAPLVRVLYAYAVDSDLKTKWESMISEHIVGKYITDSDSSLAIAKTKDFICSEYRLGANTFCAVLTIKTMEIKKSFIVDADGNIKPFSFYQTPDATGEALIACVLEAKFSDEKNNEKDYYLESLDDILRVSDDIFNSIWLDVNIPASGNFPPMTKKQVESYVCDEVVWGEPKVFMKAKKSQQTRSFEELVSDEKLKLSDGTDELTPHLTAYSVPSWMPWTIRKIVRFCGEDDSATNLMLYGPSGSGKTLGCKAMAEIMGLPYYTHVFSADSDLYNSTVQVLPNTHETVDLSLADIRFNPEEAYRATRS